MRSWVIDGIVSRDNGTPFIRLKEMPEPEPEAGQVKLRVHTGGICHTELDGIEGRTPPSKGPNRAIFAEHDHTTAFRKHRPASSQATGGA